MEPACQGPEGCAKITWRLEPGGYLKNILNARVYDIAIETPLEVAKQLSDELGNTLLLKREDLQKVFSFKVRGAFNKLAQLSQEELDRGVICASAGNHAQGVALAARTLGCKATICMPPTTTTIKIEAVKRLGGEIELVGQTYAEAQTHAKERALKENKIFVSAFDDPYIIAGQGTMGLEILRHCPAYLRRDLHAIFVPIGGGGMAAGIAALVKSIDPGILVIGVEPTGANKMAISLKTGTRVSLDNIDVFADGVAIKEPGAECFRLLRQYLDGILMVDNASISAAIKDVFNETRTILEPAGAVGVAGVKAYLKARPGIKGKTMVAVTSGANMNFDRLRLVTELADLGANREAMLVSTITGRPGTLRQFVSMALPPGTQMNITELRHRYTEDRECQVLWSVGLRNESDLGSLLKRVNAAGIPTQDISGLEEAQVHVRHLVGGRARGDQQLSNERLFSVAGPERIGAVRQLLNTLGATFNVTLFHYRKTGNRSSPILLGLQVPPEDAAHLSAATEALVPRGFTFTEVKPEARAVFDLFL
ncbi:g3902 [Coccomyxa elongata]